MLPPVRILATPYNAAQELRPLVQIATSDRPVLATNANVAPQGQISSATAGQLNLMLATPDRVSSNLAILADILSVALKMEQRPAEPLASFAARLVEAIAALPPKDQAKLQKLLMQSFAGLQLQTLLQAMQRPTGPEAATLAIYLELYRQKDRDQNTRSVISLYQQNEGEVPARNPLAALEGRLSSNAGNLSAAGQAPQSAPAAAFNRVANGPTSPFPMGDLAASPATTDAVEEINLKQPFLSRLPQTEGSANLATRLKPDDLVTRQNQGLQAESALPLATDRDADAQRVIQPPPLAYGAGNDRSMQSSSPQERDLQRSERGLSTSPLMQSNDVSPDTRSGSTPIPLGLVDGSAKPSLPVAWLAELAESELVRSLLRFHQTTDTSSPSNVMFVAREAGEHAMESQQLAMKPSASDVADLNDGVYSAVPPQGNEDGTDNGLPLPASIVAEPPGAARPLLREGVPLAFVSYFIEDEEPELDVEEQEQSRGSGQGDDHADPDGDEAEPDGDEKVSDPAVSEEGDDRTLPALQPDADTAPERLRLSAGTTSLDAGIVGLAVSEPAHGLYLRMSGLV